MNKRRLLKLADMLEADARDKKGLRFDLSVEINTLDKPGLDCGTSGCAMGLAALSGAFKRAGLSFTHDRLTSITMHGREVSYHSAACKVFDLYYSEASYLFSPESYHFAQRGAKGERAVAKRIRRFVADGLIT